jgi:hypothetical protein
MNERELATLKVLQGMKMRIHRTFDDCKKDVQQEG